MATLQSRSLGSDCNDFLHNMTLSFSAVISSTVKPHTGDRTRVSTRQIIKVTQLEELFTSWHSISQKALPLFLETGFLCESCLPFCKNRTMGTTYTKSLMSSCPSPGGQRQPSDPTPQLLSSSSPGLPPGKLSSRSHPRSKEGRSGKRRMECQGDYNPQFQKAHGMFKFSW